MRRDHFFDWHGFKFAAKVVVLCLIAGTLGRYGLLYAAQSRSSLGASPSLVLIQEKHAASRSLSLTLSTTTSAHIINTLTIGDAVPSVGKFIAVDLSSLVLTLYQDGTAVNKYPILASGIPGSPYRASPGFYTVLAKEPDRFNGAERIDLPWSIQLYGNYFIHGWPLASDGSPVNASYPGGSVRLSTEDAQKVYDFADAGTGTFVYEPAPARLPSLFLDTLSSPAVSATSYLVADIDTGDVFLEQNAEKSITLASTTKLMAALAASGAIPLDKKIAILRTALSPAKKKSSATKETFFAGDLLYPLLMGSNNVVAQSLAQEYGTAGFVDWMNATAKTLDMRSTHFSAVTGTSTENVSTADDLFRLATYLANEKSFILDIAQTPAKDIISSSGNVYRIDNANTSDGTMTVVFTVPVDGVARRVAVIVLDSNNGIRDTATLAGWFKKAAQQGAEIAKTVCSTCAVPPPYRKIQR